MMERRNARRILMGKPIGNRSLGRSRHSWEVNIQMELREIGWGSMDLIHLAQDRLL
jgi:hypothetical protein